MKGYYYLHTNGSLIYKSAFVVDSDPSYFDSSFVKKVWSFDSTQRQDAWTIVLEALASGGDVKRIKELCEQWNLTIEDFDEFVLRTGEPSELLKRGAALFAEEILNVTESDFYKRLICLSMKEMNRMADEIEMRNKE